MNLKAGMKDGERTEFDRGRFILSSVHMFGDLELSRIEAELREMNLRLALLDQVKWILGFSEHLHELLRDRVKAPLTGSEHAKLLEEADKDGVSSRVVGADTGAEVGHDGGDFLGRYDGFTGFERVFRGHARSLRVWVYADLDNLAG